jgi:hypothetical protein
MPRRGAAGGNGGRQPSAHRASSRTPWHDSVAPLGRRHRPDQLRRCRWEGSGAPLMCGRRTNLIIGGLAIEPSWPEGRLLP